MAAPQSPSPRFTTEHQQPSIVPPRDERASLADTYELAQWDVHPAQENIVAQEFTLWDSVRSAAKYEVSGLNLL